MAKPTVKELASSLRDLVSWKEFGLQLPGMNSAEIGKIEKARDDVEDAKGQLFDRWLRICPNACWNDVVEALEKVKENSIAEEIKKGHNLSLIRESSKAEIAAEQPKIRVQKNLVDELERLNVDFISLTRKVKNEIKSQVEGRVKSVADFVDHVRELRAYEVSFNSVQTIEQFFEAIHPHYNFLDYHMIMSLAVFLSPSTVTAEKAKQYKSDVEAFTQTRKIKTLHRRLDRYLKESSHCDSKVKVLISLQNSWGKHTMWLVETLVKQLFSPEEQFQWFKVVLGSLLVVFLVSKSVAEIYSQCICSAEKKEFMRLTGVIRLKVGNNDFHIDKENPHFSFENSFIAAVISNNIEVVVFLLGYMNVDVNLQITRPIRTIIDIKDSSYQTESDIHSDFGIMKSLFLSLVEDVQNHVKKLEGQAQSVRKLKYLFHYSHFLNPSVLTSDLFQKVPDFLQNRIIKYNDRILWFKKQSKITHLQKPLQELFPSQPTVPFSTQSGSLGVFITLQSAWCNCSVWCVELLVKLIFPSLPLEMFYLYRVSCDPLTVKFSTPIDSDHNIVLHSILTDDQFMHLAGVTQLWLLGTTVFEEYPNEKYSFIEAFRVAKAHRNVNAIQLLQQVINEPLAFMYDLDDNNNYSINIDPGATPLMIACFNDDMELVKKLLEYKADPNVENDRKRTALMYACRNTKMVELLVCKGAEIGASDIHGDTVLTWASFIGNVPLVKYILKCDCNGKLINAKRENRQTAFYLACKEGHLPVVKVFTAKKVDVNLQDAEGETPLFVASCNGHLSVVKHLLEKHADPNIEESAAGETPLYIASYHGHVEIVELLINNKANPNIPCKDGRTPLFAASQEGHTLVVKTLIEKQADPNIQELTYGVTPLFIASQHGHLQIVKLLLSNKADPYVSSNDGLTPLMVAAIEGHLSVLDLLLTETDVNPNCQDNHGQSPLWFASRNDHLPIVKRLLQEDNIDLGIKNEIGQTALEVAVNMNRTEIVQCLQNAIH